MLKLFNPIIIKLQPIIDYFNPRKAYNYNTNYYKPDFDRHMYILVEDLSLASMPIGGQSKNKNFDIILEGTFLPEKKQETEKLIAKALDGNDRYGRDFKNSVCTFINYYSGIIFRYGKAYWEIDFNNTQTENKPKFKFREIYNSCVKNIFGFYFQIIPKKILVEMREKMKVNKFIVINKQFFKELRLPDALGGPTEVSRLKSSLKEIEKIEFVPTKFLTESAQGKTNYFDFTEFRKILTMCVAKTTNKYCGMLRGTFNDYVLEFYNIYRHIKERRATAIVREYIINMINDSLVVVGKELGCTLKIVVKGMPKTIDYDKCLNEMVAGKLSFKDAIDRINYY